MNSIESIDLDDDYDDEDSNSYDYETEPQLQNQVVDDSAIFIENIQEEDNLVQYTENQFHSRSQYEMDIEKFKSEFLNSMDSELQDRYVRSNSPISISIYGSRDGSVNGSRNGSRHGQGLNDAIGKALAKISGQEEEEDKEGLFIGQGQWKEEQIGLRKDHYKNLSFEQIQHSLDKYYEESHANKYASEIDILTTYIKGQKHLFIQSKYLTQWKLNCLMFPCLFITAAITIIAPFIECQHWSPGLVSGLNACIALFLSTINYLKLESSTEIYLFMANHYDKIETILNMTNSKLVILDNDIEKKQLVLRKIGEIESKIKELKESYTLLIPEEVKRLFPTICHINIFLFIRKMEMHKKHLIHQFRDVKNEIRYILYRWKKKDLRDEQIDDLDTVKEKHRLSYLYTVKSNLKTEIVNYRNAYSKMEEVITNEIKMAELKKNRIWLGWTAGPPLNPLPPFGQ